MDAGMKISSPTEDSNPETRLEGSNDNNDTHEHEREHRIRIR